MTTLLWLLVALASAASPRPLQSAEWIRFAPAEGRFSVLMPVEPTRTTAETTDDPYAIRVFVARAGGEAYLAGWGDYRPDTKYDDQVEMAASRDSFVKGLNGRVISTTPQNFGEYPGIEFLAEDLTDSKLRGISRVFVVNRRLYMLAALTPAGADRPGSVFRFLASFQLTAPLP